MSEIKITDEDLKMFPDGDFEAVYQSGYLRIAVLKMMLKIRFKWKYPNCPNRLILF